MESSLALMSSFTHFAAATCETTFLGLEAWYHYLQLDNNCNVVNFTVLDPGHPSSLLLILLAIVDDLLRIAGLLAVIYVIVAGIKYITSQGDPSGAAKAQSSLINALIGLAAAIIAVWFVSFLGNALAGNAPWGPRLFLGFDLGSLPDTTGTVAGGQIILTILGLVFGLVGALAFLFLVIGGFNYITSNGDPSKAGKAKGTILYALIGVVVAIVAQSIVSFIVSKL